MLGRVWDAHYGPICEEHGTEPSSPDGIGVVELPVVRRPSCGRTRSPRVSCSAFIVNGILYMPRKWD